MKKILFVVVLSFIFAASQAQFGIKAGVNSASFNFDQATGDTPDEILAQVKDTKWGFHAGVFYRLKVAMLYIQPEAYFTSTGGKFSYNDGTAGAEDEIHTLDLNSLDIPVMVGFKLGPIRVNAGPSGHLVLSSKSDLDALKSDVKGMTWGYQAGLGFDLLGKLTFDARYEGSLSSLGDKVTIGSTDFNTDMRSSQILLSVGIKF